MLQCYVLLSGESLLSCDFVIIVIVVTNSTQLQDADQLAFPSQELADFDLMIREEGASTHQESTGRYDYFIKFHSYNQ